MPRGYKTVLTPEQEQWIIENYSTTVNRDIESRFGIGRRTLYRLVALHGLKKDRKWLNSIYSEAQTRSYNAERRRCVFGIDQRTNRPIVLNKSRRMCRNALRCTLKKLGYGVSRACMEIIILPTTHRKPLTEATARKYGLNFIEI